MLFFHYYLLRRREDVLSVNLVGDCIICLNPKVLQNFKYFFASAEILLVPSLLFSLTNVSFSHKLKFKSPSICYSSIKIFIVFKLSDNVVRNLS